MKLLVLLLLVTVWSVGCCYADGIPAVSLGLGEYSNAWAVDNNGGALVETCVDGGRSTGLYVTKTTATVFATGIAHEGGPFSPTMNSNGVVAYSAWDNLRGIPVSITQWKDGVANTTPSTIGVTKINNSGQIAGTALLSWTKQAAYFRETDGTIKEIGTDPKGGTTFKPTALDSQGKVYLGTDTLYGATTTYVYDGTLTKFVTPWGTNARVVAVSDYGALGYVDYASEVGGAVNTRKLFVEKGGAFSVIPTLPGLTESFDSVYPTAINSKGMITVDRIRDGSSGWRPLSDSYVYDSDKGSFIKLGGLEFDSAYATGINDFGLVVGDAKSLSGEDIAVSWQVPEPASFAALLSGLVGLLGLMKRKQ